MSETNIAIFASGSGTNAQNLIEYIQEKQFLQEISSWDKGVNPTVKIVLSNRKEAKVLDRAKLLNVESAIFSPSQLIEPDGYISKILQAHNIDYIILAGFLLKIPQWMIERYHKQIINIHPSLLPKYGGKGMYGAKVHEAVLAHSEGESGITIHLVNEQYDQGEHLFSARYMIKDGETAESLAQEIHKLEHLHFPKVICSYIHGREAK